MIHWTLQKRSIKSLKAHPKNARKLSKQEAEHLEKSLGRFGLIDKPIITPDGLIIGGHQRLKLLKKMGWKEVECYVPHRDLTDKEIDELNIRLNKAIGEWDWDVLANDWELMDLLEYGFEEKDFDLDPKEPKTKKKKVCPSCGHEF